MHTTPDQIRSLQSSSELCRGFLHSYNGTQNTRHYLHRMECICKQFAIPEEHRSPILLIHMEGVAATWANNCDTSPYTWTDIREKFLEQFAPRTTLSSSFRKLQELHQHLLPVADHVQQIRNLLPEIDPQIPEKELLVVLLESFAPSVRLIVGPHVRTATSVEEALQIILDVAAFTDIDRNRQDLNHAPHRFIPGHRDRPPEAYGSSKASDFRPPRQNSEERRVPPNNPFPRDVSERERRCFICGQTYHQSRNCPLRNTGAFERARRPIETKETFASKSYDSREQTQDLTPPDDEYNQQNFYLDGAASQYQ